MNSESHRLFQSEQSDLEGRIVEEMEPWVNELNRTMIAVARDLLAHDLQSKFGPSDVVQLSWLDALRDWKTIRSNRREQLVNWVIALVKNNFRDLCRAHRNARKRNVNREQSYELRELIGRDSPEAELHALELRAFLEKAIGRMPLESQVLVRWRLEDRLTFPEIASKLGRSEAAIRMAYNRSLQRLRMDLASSFGKDS